MNISGFDAAGNVKQLQNFNTRDMSAEAAASGISGISSDNTVSKTPAAAKDDDTGAELKISSYATSAARSVNNLNRTATGNFAPVNFNTAPESSSPADDNGATDKTAARGRDQVLDRYRYFVRNTRYEGSEGIVRRIFG